MWKLNRQREELKKRVELKLLINLPNSCWFTLCAHTRTNPYAACFFLIAISCYFESLRTIEAWNGRWTHSLSRSSSLSHTSAMLSSFGAAQMELRRVEQAETPPFLVTFTIESGAVTTLSAKCDSAKNHAPEVYLNYWSRPADCCHFSLFSKPCGLTWNWVARAVQLSHC